MPMKLLKCCLKQGCPELVEKGYCEQHTKEAYSYDLYRGTPTERGYGVRWRKARLVYLRHHVLCVHCEKEGRVVGATVVDHIQPHKGDKELMWNQDNWQSLCKSHHDSKTVLHDGGFGRGVK